MIVYAYSAISTLASDDYIEISKNDDDVFHEILEKNDQLDVFTNFKIPLKRESRDERKNNFGNQLLDMCKYNDLFICNCRMGDDKNTGVNLPVKTLVL